MGDPKTMINAQFCLVHFWPLSPSRPVSLCFDTNPGSMGWGDWFRRFRSWGWCKGDAQPEIRWPRAWISEWDFPWITKRNRKEKEQEKENKNEPNGINNVMMEIWESKRKSLQKSSLFLVCVCYKHYNIIKHTFKEKDSLCDHGRRMSPPQFLVLARISTGLWVRSSMLHSEKSMVQLL